MEASSSAAELPALVSASRDLKRCVESGYDDDDVDDVLKELQRFVSQIKENPDLLDPETATTLVVEEGTLRSLGLVLANYVSKRGAPSNGYDGLNGGGAVGGEDAHLLNGAPPNNIMRAVRVAQIVAEVAKIEDMREICADCGVMAPLVAAFDLDSKGELIRTHACRAVGNVCFDCDPARKAVEAAGGLNKLMDLMRRFGPEAVEELDADDASKLRRMMAGCLLNLTNTYEPLQEKSVSAGAVALIDSYLSAFNTDEELVQTLVLCLGGLSDTPAGLTRCVESGVAVRLATCIDVLAEDHDAIESLFELLTQLGEEDAVKEQLAAEEAFCERLVQVVALGCDDAPGFDLQAEEERRSLSKTAADLVIVLVTGDAAMAKMYAGGEGAVFRAAVDWLSSSHEQLQTAGVLIIGNFARNDDNCEKLVEVGVAARLVDLLKTNPLEKPEAMQHAVLSTLRNLAIPPENKKALLDGGILGTVLPIFKSPISQIQFKLLGLVRMLVDDQSSAATALGKNGTFVEIVVRWSGVEALPGIQAEASRLLAWLVKNSRAQEVMEVVTSHGAVPYLINMIGSQHTVMRNEALISLTLIFDSLPHQALREFVDPMLDRLEGLLKTARAAAAAAGEEEEEATPPQPVVTPETLANVFTLLVICGKREPIEQLVRRRREALLPLVEAFVDNEEEKVQLGAKSVIAKFA